jgi:glycosyltransferase involved in cell wall biosynthesis
MEVAVSTLLSGLDSTYDVTVAGTCGSVVEAIAAARPGSGTVGIPRVMSKRDLRSIVAQVRAVRSVSPDLLLTCHGQLFSAQYGLLAGIITRTPIVAVVHCVVPRTSRVQSLLMRFLSRRASRIVGVSQAVCSAVEDELELPRGTVTVLYNGVGDTEPRLSSPPFEAEISDPPAIGAVGRLSLEKGYGDLIEAIKDLPRAQLFILGDGPMRAELEELARRHHVADRVHFEGWVDPPWTLRWRFDVLAVPSTYEGFGLVAVEAMLAGIPVVASNVGGLAEVVIDGRNGILVEPGRPKELSRALDRMLADEVFRLTVVAQGRADALSRFSVESMIRDYQELFDDVLAPRSRSRAHQKTKPSR